MPRGLPDYMHKAPGDDTLSQTLIPKIVAGDTCAAAILERFQFLTSPAPGRISEWNSRRYIMFIQTESTPNPATLKFLPGQTVLELGPPTSRAPRRREARPWPGASLRRAASPACSSAPIS